MDIILHTASSRSDAHHLLIRRTSSSHHLTTRRTSSFPQPINLGSSSSAAHRFHSPPCISSSSLAARTSDHHPMNCVARPSGSTIIILQQLHRPSVSALAKISLPNNHLLNKHLINNQRGYWQRQKATNNTIKWKRNQQQNGGNKKQNNQQSTIKWKLMTKKSTINNQQSNGN